MNDKISHIPPQVRAVLEIVQSKIDDWHADALNWEDGQYFKSMAATSNVIHDILGWPRKEHLSATAGEEARTESIKSEINNHLASIKKPPRLVVLESPYAGDVKRNVEYARACLKDSLDRGEAPLASHLLYTQPGVLDDTVREERDQGIAAGLEWAAMADETIIYTDLGVTAGMVRGIEAANLHLINVSFRTLEGWNNEK